MQARWVYLRANRSTIVALPVDEIHRVLHRKDPLYDAFAPEADSLAASLGVEPDPDLPGVLIVLNGGDSWLAGDSSLEELPASAVYCSLTPELFLEGKPWCRGVLIAGDRRAFVSDSEMLRHARGTP